MRSLGGFTLVEVVVAIAVFALLAALLVPASLKTHLRMWESREFAVEVIRVHQEAQRFLTTGEVSSNAVAREWGDCIHINMEQEEPGFGLEVPR